MNISKDGISSSRIKSYALQIAIGILAISIPVISLIGIILTPIIPELTIRLIVSAIIGLVATSYFFMKKALEAFALDVTRQGITEELQELFDKK